jgi:hypothetical protein
MGAVCVVHKHSKQSEYMGRILGKEESNKPTAQFFVVCARLFGQQLRK